MNLKSVNAFLLFSAILSPFVFAEKRKFLSSDVTFEEGHVEINVASDSDTDNVSFFVIGDWGGLPFIPFFTPVEETMALQMAKLATVYKTNFQLGLGDNFYFDGVHNVDDKRFQDSFEFVFNSEELRQTPWFFLMGNHDHYGNASAQIEYTKKSKRWILPSYNYTINVNVGQKQLNLINILMLDTVQLCGHSAPDYESHGGQPQFRNEREREMGKLYADNLEDMIRNVSQTDTPYVIVAGHFPVWSISDHGPTHCLLAILRPLLHKYKVTAYFCGHDHNLQHLSDTYLNQTVEYVLSGAGDFLSSNTTNIVNVPTGDSKFFWPDSVQLVNGGFTLVQASPQNMTITYFEATGKELFQKVVYPRNK